LLRGELIGPLLQSWYTGTSPIVANDIVGVIVDAKQKTCSFTVNGKNLEHHHTNINLPVCFAVSLFRKEDVVEIGTIKLEN
jgi:hypothetical protein